MGNSCAFASSMALAPTALLTGLLGSTHPSDFPQLLPHLTPNSALPTPPDVLHLVLRLSMELILPVHFNPFSSIRACRILRPTVMELLPDAPSPPLPPSCGRDQKAWIPLFSFSLVLSPLFVFFAYAVPSASDARNWPTPSTPARL